MGGLRDSDHALLYSVIHRGRDGWNAWTADWRRAFEDDSLERLEQIEIDERVLTVHRLRARGRTSGVQLERIDAQL